MFSQILVKIGQIVEHVSSFSKSKMAVAAILNYSYVEFSTSPMCFESK